jgi:hypothetical protein
MGELDVRLKGKSLADYTNTQLRMALGAVLYTNTADMWDKYLKSLGYSGSVSAMLEKYYVDYAIPTQFRNYINAGAAINNPQNLFADGGVGFVYDNNDYVNPTLWRRNLLTYSEQFDNAAWFKTNVSITTNALVAPDGTTTADLITATSTSNPNVYNNTTYLGSETDYTYSVWLRAGTSTVSLVQMFTNGGSPTGNITHSAASILSGPGSVSGVGSTSITVSGLSATEWTRVRITGKGTATSGSLACYVKPFSGTATIGDSIYAWGAQLQTGLTATDYQRITDFNSNFLADYPNTTLFVDSVGTQPALVNGLVGLQLDKSGNLALGAEICAIGVFDSATGWTVPAGWTVSGGVATASATSSSLLQTGVVATAGKWYKVEFDWTHVSGTIFCRIGAGSAVSYTTSGRKVAYLLATGGAGVEFYGGTVSGTLDNVSVKELPGNHRYQTTTGSKPILRGTPVGGNIVTNGDFATDTVWTKDAGWTISAGTASKAAGSAANIAQPMVLDAGRIVRVVYTISSISGGAAFIRLIGGAIVDGISRTTAGTFTEYLTVPATMTSFAIRGASTTVATIDNIEVVDVSASAVTAPYGLQYDGVDDFLTTASVNFETATSDGLARRNLLTFPSAFDNAAWTKTNATVTANSSVAPDGTTTADLLVADTANAQHRVNFTTTVAAGTYTFSAYIKAGGYNFAWIRIGANGGYVNLTNGDVTFVSVGYSLIATAAGNGWYRIALTGAAALNDIVRINVLDSAAGTDFSGNGTSGILVWGAQLEVGSTASTFQDIGTDKMAVVMGVRKLSDAAGAMLAELSVNASTSLNAWSVRAPRTAEATYYAAAGGSIVQEALSPASYGAPNTSVVSFTDDIAGDTLRLRVNGAQVTQTLTDQGTGNFGNHAIYFGRRGGTTLPYNGLDFGGVCIGKTLTATQLANVEKWVARRTGVSL